MPMRPREHNRSRTAGSWAIGWALLCALLVLPGAVRADYAEVKPGSLTSESQERDADGQPETRTVAAKPGLSVIPSKVDLAEGGDPATYQVALRKRPSAPVVVSISPDEQTAVSINVLVFDPGGWNVPQQVSVWAVDDAVTEGLHSGTVSHYSASTDPDYTGLDPEELTATIEDNDAVGIGASPTSLTVAEPDGTAVLTLTITSPPGVTVTIPLAASNDECTIAPPSVILDQENWDSGAEATVSASDDTVEDGEQICLIQVGPSISSDPAFDSLVTNDVTVFVVDDDVKWRAFLPAVIQHWPPLPGTPVLQAISNADGDGAYTIRWDAAMRAEEYVLEESKNPAFAAAGERYAGPATVFAVEGQGAARLYYRVKAQNSWGESAWSKVQKVDVLWEAEPNDDASTQANGPLVSGLVYNGAFPNGQDAKDYYFFDLSAQGTVKIWLQNIPFGYNYDLVLRDDDLKTQPGWHSLGLGSQDEYVEAVIPAGRYYIQIHNASGLGSSQPYHLQVVY